MGDFQEYVRIHRETFFRVITPSHMENKACFLCRGAVPAGDVSYIDGPFDYSRRVCVPCWNHLFGIDKKIIDEINVMTGEILENDLLYFNSDFPEEVFAKIAEILNRITTIDYEMC